MLLSISDFIILYSIIIIIPSWEKKREERKRKEEWMSEESANIKKQIDWLMNQFIKTNNKFLLWFLLVLI